MHRPQRSQGFKHFPFTCLVQREQRSKLSPKEGKCVYPSLPSPHPPQVLQSPTFLFLLLEGELALSPFSFHFSSRGPHWEPQACVSLKGLGTLILHVIEQESLAAGAGHHMPPTLSMFNSSLTLVTLGPVSKCHQQEHSGSSASVSLQPCPVPSAK